MAIKVNLLPREDRPRRAGAGLSLGQSLSGFRFSQQLPLIVILLGVVVVGFLWVQAYREKTATQESIVKLKAQDEALKRQLTELQLAEAAKKEIQRRLDIIGRVAKSQGVPLNMMKGVLGALPQGVWLTGFDLKPQEVQVTVESTRPAISYTSETLKQLEEKKKETAGAAAAAGPKRMVTELQGYAVTIKGTAFTNFQIADFMANLRKLGLFAEVDFTSTQAATIEQVRVVQFELTASVKL